MFAKHVRSDFKRIRTIIPEFSVSTTASVANSSTLSAAATAYSIGSNFSITIQCTTGNVWINPTTVASTANSFKLSEGLSLDLQVETALSLISDSTTASIQAIIWEG